MTEVPSKTRKYRTFQSKSGGYYFVGKAGAVRVNRASQAVSGSMSVTAQAQEKFLQEVPE